MTTATADAQRTMHELIEDVRKTAPWNKLRTRNIESTDDFRQLIGHRVLWYPRGRAWIMAFLKRANNYYSFFVDRDTIFSRRPRLILFKTQSDVSLYNGTIIEGVIVRDRTTKKQIFVMHDVHLLCGVSMQKCAWSAKMVNLHQEIDTKISMNPLYNSFDIAVSSAYPISDLRAMVTRGTEHFAWATAGLMFIPTVSTTGPRWFFSEDTTATSIAPIPMIVDAGSLGGSQQRAPSAKQITAAAPTTDPLAPPADARCAVLEMHKTDLPQVYELYSLQPRSSKTSQKTTAGDDTLSTTRKHVGLASIPTIAIGKYCEMVFDDLAKKRKTDDRQHVQITCYYNEEHDRWIPFKLAGNRRSPDRL